MRRPKYNTDEPIERDNARRRIFEYEQVEARLCAIGNEICKIRGIYEHWRCVEALIGDIDWSQRNPKVTLIFKPRSWQDGDSEEIPVSYIWAKKSAAELAAEYMAPIIETKERKKLEEKKSRELQEKRELARLKKKYGG